MPQGCAPNTNHIMVGTDRNKVHPSLFWKDVKWTHTKFMQKNAAKPFPTYNEWLHNLTTPNAERIRAEERIEMRESFGDWGDQDNPDFDY